MIKGYARVTTDGQDLATQHELLKEAGATLVFSEKQSVIKTDRAALARCIASLEPGDTVLVTKLDRLAREHSGLAQHASRESAKLGRTSSRWVILGRTPPPRTGD
jgi:DNA invertase Pin-like site-specific DNA recombinase